MNAKPPFGLWPSPLTPRAMAAAVRLDDVQWDTDGRRVVWLESRDGRGALWCLDITNDDAARELTPGDMAVRGRVGYGGGDFTVAGGYAFFAEAGSGRLFRQSLDGGRPRSITPAFGVAASPACSPDDRWLLFVHSYEDEDCLAVVDAEGRQWPQRLATGHDFYMWPCWHPGGARIAYVTWDHPQMPWDGGSLRLAELDLGGITPTIRADRELAGGPATSIFQPTFAPDGRHLAYVSDADGWWHIYLYDLASQTHRRLTEGAAEHGEPAWAQGMRTLAWSRDGRRLYYLRNEGAARRVCVQPVDGGPSQTLSDGEGYSWFEQPAASPGAEALVGIASSPTTPPRVMLADGRRTRVLRRSSGELEAQGQLASALPVSWAQPGAGNIYGLLYLPPGYVPGGSGPRPPAVVRVHGGPTGQAVMEYSRDAQFLATRGYVVLEVNYRGSTGYGRAYTQALREQWGVYDVADLIGGAHYLAAAGIADPARLVAMGGSAGGYTLLEALCQPSQPFCAGVCLYGVTSLFSLAADTHKFEAHYLDSLVGPLPAAAERYRERSPLFHAERVRTPLAIFQGAEDKVVPPGQAEAIVAALRRNGVPHIYHLFPGEGHGWRRAETIEAYYRALEGFLRDFVIFA
ncbi:MAG: prolyl oligopeptidase family serine peptidase [Chloroflexi bacterium OHK40]